MILAQGITTSDGTMLCSRHRHDFVTYKDKNGKTYMVDGGTDYLRMSGHGDEYIWYVTDDDHYEVIRQFVGRNGKKGFTPLAKMSNDYLLASVGYAKKHNQELTWLLLEVAFRLKWTIYIPE
jgi:hypothetical protein